MASDATTLSTDDRRIIAYRVHDISDGTFPQLVPAPADRDWMEQGTGGWANRCLPLRIANQCGWFLLNDCDFVVAWDGRNGLDAVQIRSQGDAPPYAQSMFGFGTLTWVIPYLFRTPAGVNLLIRGPANEVKDGIAPLDGIVETDWLSATFTVNWKFTRPFKKVAFRRGEPIAMILPIRRGDVETLVPEIRNIESDPKLYEEFTTWHEKRLAAVANRATGQGTRTIQAHYIRGETASGEKAREHQNHLDVAPFVVSEPALKAAPVQKGSGATAKPFGFFAELIRKLRH